MLSDQKVLLKELAGQIADTWSHLNPDKISARIDELQELTVEDGFWNDREKAESVIGEMNGLRKKLESWDSLNTRLEDTETLYELAVEDGDEGYTEEIESSLKQIREDYEALKLLEMLNDEFDKNDAYLTIHSGAGGTEACDWVRMLYRMYTRWAERRDFKIQLLDMLEAEGGIKSVTFQLNGLYAYGYLKGESGIHRLVRISPFDSNARRHTSFASVHVSPVISDDIEIDIKPDELRIDTYRAQGAGGQHVNTTDSAVRITHLPTGLVVQCQNERSQHKNKASAMKILQSRLYEHIKMEQEKEKEKLSAEKKDIGWGSQIRSYVFQPYTMVKDHRTKFDVGNINAVMDGAIDPFIETWLKWNMGE